jgi:hypothetical protein
MNVCVISCGESQTSPHHRNNPLSLEILQIKNREVILQIADSEIHRVTELDTLV